MKNLFSRVRNSGMRKIDSGRFRGGNAAAAVGGRIFAGIGPRPGPGAGLASQGLIPSTDLFPWRKTSILPKPPLPSYKCHIRFCVYKITHKAEKNISIFISICNYSSVKCQNEYVNICHNLFLTKYRPGVCSATSEALSQGQVSGIGPRARRYIAIREESAVAVAVTVQTEENKILRINLSCRTTSNYTLDYKDCYTS